MEYRFPQVALAGSNFLPFTIPLCDFDLRALHACILHSSQHWLLCLLGSYWFELEDCQIELNFCFQITLLIFYSRKQARALEEALLYKDIGISIEVEE